VRTEQLSQPTVVTAAYAATVRAQVAILTTLNAEIKTMEEQVEAHFGQHPDAEIYLSQPGLGVVLGARVLAEFGDSTTRYCDARARKNYAGTSRQPTDAAWATRPDLPRAGPQGEFRPGLVAVTAPPAGALRLRDGRASRHPRPGQAEQTLAGARQPGCLASRRA
jgi:hypothetical protein